MRAICLLEFAHLIPVALSKEALLWISLCWLAVEAFYTGRRTGSGE
jgi:hypothetical protein